MDQTIAYALSGGQASDSGRIGGYEILQAEKVGREIIYTIEKEHNLKEGQEVLLEIDWDRRYKLMRLHFAAELVLELVYQEYNRPEKIGANISPSKARVDFYWEGNISKIFPDLMDKVEDFIEADLDIISGFEDEENEIRYWEIDGFARVPCGGTHLRKTGEIGKTSFKRRNLGAGKERIEISLED